MEILDKNQQKFCIDKLIDYSKFYTDLKNQFESMVKDYNNALKQENHNLLVKLRFQLELFEPILERFKKIIET